MSSKTTPDGKDIVAALEQFSREDLLSLVKSMVQRYPDLSELIATTQETGQKQHIPFNANSYRKQITEVFYTTDTEAWSPEDSETEPLQDIIASGDTYIKHRQYDDATTLYGIIIQNILENYYSFSTEDDDGYLNEMIEVCTSKLGKCLRSEVHNTAVRKQILQMLCDIYEFDLALDNDDELAMSRSVPPVLVRYTTAAERKKLARWLRQTLDLDINWHSSGSSSSYNTFLLGLEADTIDDETFFRICRKTGNYNYLIERLLKAERLDEALAEIAQVKNSDILESATILDDYGYEDQALKIIEERSNRSEDTDLLAWLKERYSEKGNIAGALEMAKRIFREIFFIANLKDYGEIRQFAQQLGRWETVGAELLNFLYSQQHIPLLIKIALEEDQVEKALELLFSQRQTENNHDVHYGSDTFEVGIEVAKAAEASHLREAIEIYQGYAETRIEWRGRENYRKASQYLAIVHSLYQHIGQNETWTKYIAALRERHRNLPALRDELKKAGV